MLSQCLYEFTGFVAIMCSESDIAVTVLIINCACICVVQEMIEQYVHWNEEIGEWQLKCVAYTGNNMRKQTPQPDKEKDKVRYCQQLECTT